MSALTQVSIAPLEPSRFETVLGAEAFKSFDEELKPSRELLDGRVVWNINSTAAGGGVAEMLRPLLAYANGAGVDTRWAVISASSPDFFTVTKRIHNHLHGVVGDGGELGDAEHEIYQSELEANVEGLRELVSPEDIVVLHDPQTAGLAGMLRELGIKTAWRCHVGLDLPNETARVAWRFLLPYVQEAQLYVFSREAFAWEGLDPERIVVIPPSIDAFSPKNQDMEPAEVDAIVRAAGLGADATGHATPGGSADPSEEDADGGQGAEPTFARIDGSTGRVERRAEMVEDAPVAPGARLVVQVSRWDRLKDPLGVIDGFVREVVPHSDAELLLAGPAVEAVSDDPEGKQVLDDVCAARDELPDGARERVHLACLPMDDGDENAAMVNALQRRATIIVQKSLAEGFGLTVAEAMWKARPVVASRIGGIQDQMVHGETGLLLDDPADPAAFGDAVRQLLDEPERAKEMGEEARRRVREEYLGARHLQQWFDLFRRLVEEQQPGAKT